MSTNSPPPEISDVFGPALKPDGGRARRPYRPAVEQLLNRPEARHRPAVVRHEQRHACAGARADHLVALSGCARHRLLHIDGLARSRYAKRVVAVGVRRGGDVHRVDLRIRDQRVGVVIPARDPVPPRVVGGLVPGSTHHRHQRRAVRLLQGRPALDLRDAADADDPPPHHFHARHRSREHGPSRQKPGSGSVSVLDATYFWTLFIISVNGLPSVRCAHEWWLGQPPM
jgi:hypothetical protein